MYAHEWLHHPPAVSIWEALARLYTTICLLAKPAAGSYCASKTRTRNASYLERKRRSFKAWSGWASRLMKVRSRVATMLLTAKPNGARFMINTAGNLWKKVPLFHASVRPSVWKGFARNNWHARKIRVMTAHAGIWI